MLQVVKSSLMHINSPFSWLHTCHIFAPVSTKPPCVCRSKPETWKHIPQNSELANPRKVHSVLIKTYILDLACDTCTDYGKCLPCSDDAFGQSSQWTYHKHLSPPFGPPTRPGYVADVQHVFRTPGSKGRRVVEQMQRSFRSHCMEKPRVKVSLSAFS